MQASKILAFVVASLRAIDARLNPGETNSRCNAMRDENRIYGFTQKTANYLAQSGLTEVKLSAIFPESGKINPTVPYRFTQFVNALHAATYGQIDRTTARALLALRAANGQPLNRDALANLLTGRVKIEGVCPNTRGISITGLDKLVGRIGRDTVETQLSRSFGESGFCGVLGMTESKGKTNFSVSVNPENLYVKRFYALIDGATKGQLGELFNEGKGASE